MLYIDVLCRGYHPKKGFESDTVNIIKNENTDLNNNNIKVLKINNN